MWINKVLTILFLLFTIFLFSNSIVFAAIIGDVNSDGKVTIVDIGIIIDNYGKLPITNTNTDLNKDNKVDIVDIGIVIDNYSKTGTAATPIATATPNPGGSSDYLIINRNDLINLPTNNASWNSLKSAADASGGTPDLCNQNTRNHPGTTLAAALVYARTGDQNYYNKARSMIFAAMPTLKYPCTYNPSNGALSLGRQLGAYVIAADLIKLNDNNFNSWLRTARDANVGDTSHPTWRSLRSTARTSASNWSTFCLASLIAADRFLGDTAMLNEDWNIFKGYGTPFGWNFTKTGDYNEAWTCVPSDSGRSSILPIAINTSCVKSGYNLDGGFVEDNSRTSFPTVGNYPAEDAQGLVLQALLLSRAGFDGWGVNNQQVKRNALFRERFGNLNYSNADYYVQWMINKFYGLNQAKVAAGSVGFGRVFGYADWLFGN